jgi:uncharacterized protein (DUF4415 family)
MKKFDPKHAAKNGYTNEDWDSVDSSELTDEELATASTLAEALPDLSDALEKEVARRGRPPLERPKQAVSIRLDADLVEALRSSGKGWQSRANDMLREAIGL